MSKKAVNVQFLPDEGNQVCDITSIPHLSCNLCNFVTAYESKMVEHVLDVHELFHQCYLCHVGLNSWQEFFTHMRRRHLPTKSKLYTCKECDATHSVFELFVLHHMKHFRRTRRRRRKKDDPTTAGDASDNIEISKKDDDTNFKEPDPVSAKKSSKFIFISKDSFKCCLCTYWTRSSHSFDDHMRRHTNVREFFCNRCLKAFVSKGELARHVACRHPTPDTPQHQCPHCRFYSWRKDVLRTHVRGQHSAKDQTPAPVRQKRRRVVHVDDSHYQTPEIEIAAPNSAKQQHCVLRSILTSDKL